MSRKVRSAYIILVFIAALALAVTVLFCAPEADAAFAAGWKVRVTKVVDGKYIDLSTGDTVTDATEFTFLISDYAPGDSFQYYISDNNLDKVIQNVADGWIGVKTDDTVVVDGKTYRYATETFDSKVNKYIYFRRTYTDDSGARTEHYYARWNLIVNRNLSQSDLGIVSEDIKATYVKNNVESEYSGEWIGTGLRFVVTTAWMQNNGGVYDSGDELLYYSTDGKEHTDKSKLWIPMQYEYVTVTKNLKNATVDFKTTDLAGNYAAYGSYARKVNIDAAEPIFTVNAFTTDVNGAVISYQNMDWSCSAVTFTLSDASQCISNVEYFVSIDGINYERIPTMSYVVSRTTAGLRFRASNSAGVIYDYRRNEDFNVNIDDVRPGAAADALTLNPADETKNVALPAVFDAASFAYKAGYANGQLTLSVYNRDPEGNYVYNASGAKFFYAVKSDDGEYSAYREMTNSSQDGAHTYYSFTDSLNTGVSVKRTYKFYVMSGAGLTSNETTFEVTLLNSIFEIEVQEIEYVPNVSGWAAAAIPVYVTVPTDSVIQRDYEGNITGYTAPTTKYTFFYSPTNITGALYSAEGEYYSHVENVSGKSVYVFYLSASAESTFTVYAQNAAGKRSANTYSSINIIKIDVLKPEVEVTAYIKPETDITGEPLYIASAEWVNGRIIVTLTVKDGVSGVYVKDMKYAVDGNGNPVLNADGKMVWQEVSGKREPDGSIHGDDGSTYFVYNIEIGLPDSTTVAMSEEYRFRVYTNSGVYTDVSFIANIDTTGIILEQLSFDVGGRNETVAVDSNSVRLSSVCEDGVIELIANGEQNGHFDYYLYDDVRQAYVRVDGSSIPIAVPDGTRGEIVRRLYLVSRAKDYLGGSYTTSTTHPYEIIIPYNTLNISISRELVTDTSGAGTEWVSGDLTVRINLLANEEGDGRVLSNAEKANYTYYYMLIDFSAGLDLNAAINNGTWLPVSDSGAYNEKDEYEFLISFANSSFYGYIALSVTNEAGFRSSDAGEVAQLLRIDCTTPSISDMIVTVSGIDESATVEGLTTVTYYSRNAITITPKNYNDRSTISYYYIALETPGSAAATENPSAGSLNGWTKLERDLTISASGYGSYYYIFYAVNELGADAGGMSDGKFSTQYRFVIDTADMGGNLSYDASSGGYFDSSLNMYTYMWESNAKINLYVTNSNTEVKYYYSIDDGKSWHVYAEAGGERYYGVGESNAFQLVFNADYFPDGVNNAFAFKAVNKAGTEYVYGEKIYIAIDTMSPEFEVVTTVGGIIYDGGSLNLSDKSAANWSSLPVTIEINMIKVNKSGVRLTYLIEYMLPTGQTFSSAERETPSATKFTTDRLDGFNKNRDALITIRATSRADARNYTEKTFRVKVDQVEPVFSLTGRASNDDSGEPIAIVSGQWTNRRKVEITRASDENYVNVSGVTYKYTRRDLESTATVENAWPEGNPSFDKICTITVTATTDAGLTHTQVFQVNIDTIAPQIKFRSNMAVVEHAKHYIDINVYVEEENIEICEYITTRGETRGFALDPLGYIISTSSVDNSIKYDPNNPDENEREYRGYVKIYVKDYAGNEASYEFYMLPFALDVNNVTLSDEDLRTVDKYEEDLEKAKSYMETSRVTYFRNLISRLRDRISTLRNEIATYREYLEKLAQRTSFELKSDYWEMFEYLETYNNYALFGQAWIQDAIKGDASSKYYGYFENLQLVFGTLQAEMQAVFNAEDNTKKLPAINVVEANDYNDVLAVYNQYLNLTGDQKACFATNLYTKLLTLKKRCEILLLSDEDTGVMLDANFAPNARIKVETFSEDSAYFNNAQTAVWNEVKDSEARAVASIYRVSLTGAASQTATGDIVVTLPIPEDYRQYIRFAVYKMGVDGTITPVEDMKIAGDGRSVTFTSDELSTFVLAVKANLQTNVNTGKSYGTFLGLELDVEMIRTLAIVGTVLFIVIIVVVIIAGVRHKRFLNTYNRAYKSGIYRRGVQRIPKGNTVPRENPLKPGERVKTQKQPY